MSRCPTWRFLIHRLLITLLLVLVGFTVGHYTANAATPPRLTKAQIAYWNRLHNCEQPSGWHGGFPKYPGGLGIYWGTWNWGAGELGLLWRYPNGAAAPPLVQMQVAQYGYERHRWYWGCFRHVGYPPR